MRRAIVAYHLDEEQHWVGDLACGHSQHLRHNPPFTERAWVTGERTRASMLGHPLDCKLCDTEVRMLSPPIDHVVITVRDLNHAARQYDSMGFTLTPRAEHPWGTANRLVQFEGRNFLELLEIDRPQLLSEHDAAAQPPAFSFGAFNRDFLKTGLEGFAMLVLAGSDSRADVARFKAAGLDTYRPFDFERQATLPDGRKVTVAFSLAIASDAACPRAACFTCHNQFPENFWKPQFQSHANGAVGVREAVLVAEHPAEHQGFVTGFTGSAAVAVDGGIATACGPHALSVLTPKAFATRFDGAAVDLSQGPRFAAIVIATTGHARGIAPTDKTSGITIAWQPA